MKTFQQFMLVGLICALFAVSLGCASVTVRGQSDVAVGTVKRP